MKKQLIKIFAILSGILTFAHPADAKSSMRPQFKVPFDFIVKRQTFPAGKYSVERLNPASPNFLILRQVDGTRRAILMIQTTGDREANYKLQLSFNFSESTYFLKGIWVFGEKYTL